MCENVHVKNVWKLWRAVPGEGTGRARGGRPVLCRCVAAWSAWLSLSRCLAAAVCLVALCLPVSLSRLGLRLRLVPPVAARQVVLWRRFCRLRLRLCQHRKHGAWAGRGSPRRRPSGRQRLLCLRHRRPALTASEVDAALPLPRCLAVSVPLCAALPLRSRPSHSAGLLPLGLSGWLALPVSLSPQQRQSVRLNKQETGGPNKGGN